MILVVRPAPHLPRTIAALEAAGLTDIIPLALSEPQSVPAHIPAAANALLFTSPLGVQPGLPDLPAYCVGQATATAARQAGYTVVYTGADNGVAMARDIFEQKLPARHFAHLHGDHAGMQWHAILQLAGHIVTPVLSYKTCRITALPPRFALPDSSFVLLFSAGSANHLANLLKHVTIRPNGTAVCFSPAVARVAATHWPQVVTATAPNLGAMVATIRRLAR